MKKMKWTMLWVLVACMMMLAACGSDDSNDNNDPVGDQDPVAEQESSNDNVVDPGDEDEQTPADEDNPADEDEPSEEESPGDEDEPAELEENTAACSGHGILENGMCYCDLGWAVDPDDSADCIEYIHEDGVPYLLKIYMHSPSATKIYFSTMSVIGDIEATDYDIYVSHLDGPSFELGANVQAIDLGNTDAFDDVDEVPETGYATDGADVAGMIIGTSYRSGGTGSTGFTMSENIYALKIGDGNGNFTYAKIEVKQAKAGEVHVLAYWQPDGSRDVSTSNSVDGDMDAEDEVEAEEEGTNDEEPSHVFRSQIAVVFDANMNDKVSFDTMTAIENDGDTWDFELFGIGGGPGIRLGDGVTAIDNGNTVDFYDVDAAPDSGYAADADPTYIIGAGFRNGGSGGAGFVMTENVYILKRADGSYAKLEVLNAQSGVFGFQVYHQAGTGTDLTTHDQPGETDIWAHVIINCTSGCNTGDVVIYGNTGSAVAGMPTFMNTWDSDIAFPLHAIITQTGMMGLGPLSQGQHALRAYQDIDSNDGMGYQDGDPVSEDIVIDFQAGQWNLLTFDLE